MFLNCYLRNYDHIAEYLLVAIIIPLYFQKTDISFTYLVCTCTYLCQWPFTIRNVCISLLHMYYVESFMECALDKLYITENVSFLLNVFLTSIHVHHFICNSCWNLQIEIKSPKSDFFL